MEIYLAVLGLILSFFFAGSEAAFTSFNKLRLEAWHRQEVKHTKYAVGFVEKPQTFFSTILVGNNAANILYSTYATVFLIAYLDETLSWAIITLTVLLFGEILPKTLFRSLADFIILKVFFIVRLFYNVMAPFIRMLNVMVEQFLVFLNVKHEPVESLYTREELELLLREGYNAGIRDFFEQKYLEKILQFYDARVKEAMVPRTDIIAAREDSAWDDVKELMAQSGKLRIPIYKENIDNVIGIVFIYDMLQPAEDIRNIIRPVQHVPETKSCAELLTEFKRDNTSIAVVLDEHGGTAGLITMDDLIERVFGEFEDKQQAVPKVKALNDHTWLIDARLNLEALWEETGVRFPEGEYETLSGLIITRTGRIPEPGEWLRFGNIRLQVKSALPNRVDTVKLIK